MEISPSIRAQLERIENENIAIEPPDGAVTLRDKLGAGVSAEQFVDYLLQICDVVEFLATQKKPIVHNDISASSLVVCEDDLLKLTKFEQAVSRGDATEDLRAIGELICSTDAKFAKKYHKIGKACLSGEYETVDELRYEIINRASAKRKGIYKVTLIVLLLALIYWRLVRRFL